MSGPGQGLVPGAYPGTAGTRWSGWERVGERFLPRPLTRLRDQAFELVTPGRTSSLGAEFLTGEFIEQRRLVVFRGPLQEPIGECVDGVPADLAIAEMRLTARR